MSYIGSTPTTQSFIAGTDYFSGTGSQTAFTLSRSVVSVNDIQATVNNVVQVPNDAYTVSGTTITFTSAPSAGTNNVYVRYLSTTTQAITPSQNTVSWNTLDTNTQNDLGISYKNKIINGNMVIAQRTAGAVTSVATARSTGFALDRWSVWLANWIGGAATQQQSTDVPSGQGFVNSLLVTVTGASSTTDTSGRFLINQMIEGFNIADLNWGTASAKSITFSFWVKSSVTGNYGLTLTNSAGDRAYVISYAINSANTWERKTATIPGDTSGTWTTNNTAGITINYDLSVNGPTTDTVNTWLAGDFRGLTSGVNLINTLGATFYLTGVQLEVGTQATTFTTAGGSYGAELALCQRYYVYYEGFVAGTYSGTAAVTSVNFPVQMRASPTVSASNPIIISQPGVADMTQSSANATIYGGNRVSQNGCAVNMTNFSGLTSTIPFVHNINFNGVSPNAILFSAEL